MAMITDISYALQAIRLSALRYTDDPLTPRIISLDPSFALNPYIDASGLSDIDRWPEIKRALDSPPLDYPSSYDSLRNARNERATRDRSYSRNDADGDGRREGGLKYTQTIMGPGRSGGLGMRVTGRRTGEGDGRGRNARANSTEALSPMKGKIPLASQPRIVDDGFFSPSRRPRADSAPVQNQLVPPMTQSQLGSSLLASGHGLGGGALHGGTGLLDQALSFSETSGDMGDVAESLGQRFGTELSSAVGRSARRTDSETAGDMVGGYGETMVDEGSDVEEGDMELDQEGGVEIPEDIRQARDESRRSSMFYPEEKLSFAAIPIPRPAAGFSSLTTALNKHIPHLVSTSHGLEAEDELAPLAQPNPFASLYTTVAAPTSVPFLTLELFFPHSDSPTVPLIAKVRKDASVEDVTGYGLYKYWEEGRQPGLNVEDAEERWTTVGWGLRIVEDDGEVDEDFPPLDRDSKISKFSYGQFGIVEATPSQIKQNAAKAPLIIRRPSRIIAQPSRPSRAASSNQVPITRPPIRHNASSASSLKSFSSAENMPIPTVHGADGTFKGSVGFSSALAKQVILRVRVTASADVHFTTTISVPADIYIADLTEILCKKKRLAPPYTDWVLCLADLTLAIPVDRTVASLEGKNDLALVRTQWAVEHGLKIGDRRGGDPSASIFKRQSEPNPAARFGPGLADFAQTYKVSIPPARAEWQKYKVNRKIAIGRHERTLAIDGDYIHIMPSESRAFFDSMKTTSFHISLVASVKLSGRSGGFKINVWREAGQKRYEFEAENERQAIEIVSTVQGLMRGYLADRSSMLPTPRSIRKR